ncbi:MAG: serine/threonine protein kinase [Clostridiales bacterium]|nr:serine/threonine protein kinase [Clostridiales bacterium]
MAAIGTLVDGKYEILREIGRGGMSVVYLAMDIRLNKQWAIKEIARKANDANNEIVVSSLIAEANLMKKLDHPALPRIVDIIEESNIIYVVMDYIEGEPLSKILELYGAQDQDVVIEWGKQLCDVLYYLHNCEPPIIYRDMKPANIMLKPDGTVKLIDFGIAREYKRSKTADTESLGTRGYAAPEQFGGKGQTDARTDIYSFGVTLYHLVTGKNPCEPPYELYPIKQINPDFYDGLQYLIQKCIQLNPDDRFQSCDEIRYVLDNIQEFDKGRRINQRRKYMSFIAMIVMCVVCIGLGIGSLGMRSATVTQSLEENLAVFEDSAKAESDLSTALHNITKEDYFEASDKIKACAEYYEALYNLYSSGGSDSSINDDYLQVDVYEYCEDDGSEASVYDQLDQDDRAYFAKACYYRGRLYYSKLQSSSSSKIMKSIQNCFEYICDDSKLNLENSTYDTTIFSENNLQMSKAFYIMAKSILAAYPSSQSSSTAYVEEGSSTDYAADFRELLDLYDIVNESFGEDQTGLTIVYYSYMYVLSQQAYLSKVKSAGVTADEVDELYTIVYGESFEDVCARAESQTGKDVINIDSKESVDAGSGVTSGITAVEISNNLVDTVISNRFAAAKNIYKIYIANS